MIPQTITTPFGAYDFEVGACSNVDDRHVRAIVWAKPHAPYGRPSEYRTVRNINGSNRFMQEDAYWSFMPDEFRDMDLVARRFASDCAALTA